ncbi:MAG: cation/multidrug efflux pump [Gemmatimonadota bacterium]
MSILHGIALAAPLIALFLFLSSAGSFRAGRPGRGTVSMVAALLLLLVGLLFGAIAVGTQGYRALTREEVAAVVRSERVSPDSFVTRFTFPDGISRTFRLTGEQLYVDAHILKWKPIVNVLGLHTGYELDRVSGRWRSLEDERNRPRTVYELAVPKPIDFFDLAIRFRRLLAPIGDAQYGSASFVPVGRSRTYELRVSTSGLLFREVE